MRRITGQRGFTLIELMLVVGIIGALAAIAVPNFISYQARSRRSESFTNLSGIARAQLAYQAERNYFHDTALPYPDWTLYNGMVLSSAKMPWDADSQMAFGTLGWEPEGKVYYSYAAWTSATGMGGPNCNSCPLCFTAAAYGDVDDNGFPQTVLYVHPDQVGGVLSWCNEGLFGDPPPVDPITLAPIFDAVAARSNSDF